MTTMTAALVAVLAQSPAAAPAPAAPLTPAQQIAAAVQAAPEERRADATVMGYDESGKLVTLRQGKNDLICLADNPKSADFEVDCYQKDLEPFMARGRELAAQGVKGKEKNETRWKEIEEGKLAMPKSPSTLYIVEGKGYEPATGTIAKAYRRWVVYTPYATPESTGLSTMPIPGGPWLMFPGKPTAHIMIDPPEPDEKK
jgi:hypothetical protein